MNDTKTIKEAADLLGVTVQTIYRRLNKLDAAKEYQLEKDGIRHITAAGIELIDTRPPEQRPPTPGPGETPHELIAELRKQNAILEKQLEAVNRQLEQLNSIRLIEAETRLHDLRRLNAGEASANLYTRETKEVKEGNPSIFKRLRDKFTREG